MKDKNIPQVVLIAQIYAYEKQEGFEKISRATKTSTKIGKNEITLGVVLKTVAVVIAQLS